MPRSGSAMGSCSCAAATGVFPELSVEENLRMAAFAPTTPGRAHGRRDRQRLSRFPTLVERRTAPARDLSGGKQQMLALAMALVHEPEILLIDELSLGLAPLVVEELLGVVQGSRRGHDDDHRGAVAERRARLRRPRDVHGEGPGAVRRSGGRAGRARRPRAGRLPRWRALDVRGRVRRAASGDPCRGDRAGSPSACSPSASS